MYNRYDILKKMVFTLLTILPCTAIMAQDPVGNITTSLAGKIPGLFTIQSSAEPQLDESTLYIRGTSTYGTSTPLVIIDGFARPISDFGIMNPYDIESIEILKDAAGTALYGIQGGNGVIIVKTKRGSDTGRTAPRISFSVEQAVLQATRTPEMMGALDQAQYFQTKYANDGISQRYTDQAVGLLADGSSPYLYPTTNWYDVIMKNITNQQRYNISFSGTAGKTHNVNYYVSGSYFRQGTLMNHQEEFTENYNVKSAYDRFNFRSNVDFQATKRFSLRADFSASLQSKTSPYSGFSDLLSVITQQSPNSSAIFNPDGSIAASSAVSEYSTPGNPYGLLTRSAYCTTGNNCLAGSIEGKYDLNDFVKGLEITGSYNFQLDESIGRYWSQSFDSYSYLGKSGGVDVYSKASEYSRFSNWSSSAANSYQYYDLRANYSRNFQEHSVSGSLCAYRKLKDLYSSQYTYGYQGLSLQAGYNYAGKYFANIDLGVSGSENFHPDHRYGFFPAASLKWVISEHASLRTSYGLTGNDILDGTRFIFLSEYTQAGTGLFDYGYYFGTNTSGFGASSNKGYNELVNGNASATWDKSRKFNFGVDFNLLQDGSLSGSVDVFHDYRYDIFTAALKVPDYLGVENVAGRNAGIVVNRGVEFQFAYNKQLNSDFSFFANLNGTYAKNKVIENDYPDLKYEYQNLRGHEVGCALGYKSLGFFKDQDDIDNSPKQSWGEVIPGDVKYQDTNEDGIVDEYDRVPIKCTALPVFTGALNLGFNWKNLDFSMLFTGTAGGTVQFYSYDSSILNLQRWTVKNASTAILPVAHTSTNNSLFSDWNITRTDHIKLRNVELGYNLYGKFLPVIGVNKIRFFANIQNVFTIDAMPVKDRDPELAGTNTIVYPLQRVYNLGIRFDI